MLVMVASDEDADGAEEEEEDEDEDATAEILSEDRHEIIHDSDLESYYT